MSKVTGETIGMDPYKITISYKHRDKVQTHTKISGQTSTSIKYNTKQN